MQLNMVTWKSDMRSNDKNDPKYITFNDMNVFFFPHLPLLALNKNTLFPFSPLAV